MVRRRLILLLGTILVAGLLLAACGGGSDDDVPAASDSGNLQVAEASNDLGTASETGPATTDEDHQDGDAHTADEHMADTPHQEGDTHAADEHTAEMPHQEGDDHAEAMHETDAGHAEGEADHEGGHDEAMEHGLPEEALALENPVPATAESIAAGTTIYAQFCAVCHGNEGRGDGPGAAALNPKPADLSADHVQVLTDGGLYWIVTNGVPGTAMPPWEGAISEQDRWNLVNYLRTFDSGQ